MYERGKPRKLDYDNFQTPITEDLKDMLKQIYGSVNYGDDPKSFDGIIKM